MIAYDSLQNIVMVRVNLVKVYTRPFCIIFHNCLWVWNSPNKIFNDEETN